MQFRKKPLLPIEVVEPFGRIFIEHPAHSVKIDEVHLGCLEISAINPMLHEEALWCQHEEDE